jgi:hypothetical protein
MSDGDDQGAAPASDPEPGQAEPADAGPGAEAGRAAAAVADAKTRQGTADGDPDTEREAGEQAREQLTSLGSNYSYNTNNFYARVDGSGATFGNVDGPASDEVSRRTRTGRLTEEEISDLCEHFAEPALFPVAVKTLARDQVIGVGGASGLGKRASAVRLLLDVGAGPLEVVSPALTLEELSKQDFEKGHGYLVEDWQLAPRARDAGDYSWRVLRDHVKDGGAHLVITGAARKGGQSVTTFAWTAPTAAQVLAVYLDGHDTAGLIAEIAAKVPDSYGVGALAAIGKRLARGEDPEKLLEELSHDPGRHVREWLCADERTDSEIQQVTALSFAAGQSERLFEVMLIRLASTLREDDLLPDPAADKRGKDAADGDGVVLRPPGLRGLRTRRRSGGLLERADGSVRFCGKDPGYQYLCHRHALQELWREYDMTFWLAVRGWLTELIGDTTVRDVQVSVATGLALLAFTALDEVEDSYLHPWAAGEKAWSGQCTAVYVLWLMSRDDALAPVALRIATDWVNSGDPAYQWTAAAALSGDLGVVYPAPAASRLWHLVGQWRDVPAKAVVALATLFATLTREREGQEAYQVLELLRERLRRASVRNGQDEDGKPGRPPAGRQENRKNRDRALLCIVEVLAARDPRGKQPAVTSFLDARPEHLGLVAELWAVVIRHRPLRKRALVALLNAVRGFEYVSEDPQAAASALGDALTEALPQAEHQPLKRDFTNILARSSRPDSDTAATVQALLDAIKHLEPTERTAQ